MSTPRRSGCRISAAWVSSSCVHPFPDPCESLLVSDVTAKRVIGELLTGNAPISATLNPGRAIGLTRRPTVR